MKVDIGPYPDVGGKRKIKVEIDNYDVWSMDYTLSLIIHPMLVKLKEQKTGEPFIDDEDVPENIRSCNAHPKENEWDIDEFHSQRWEWVLQEMIYAHDPDWEDKYGLVAESYDRNEYSKNQARRDNGFRLFGKYYQALWT